MLKFRYITLPLTNKYTCLINILASKDIHVMCVYFQQQSQPTHTSQFYINQFLNIILFLSQ